MKKLFFFALATVASMHVMVSAQLATGRNINVHPGIVDQFVGDMYLQRQLEPKIVCSGTNTQHCVAIANDYRTVDATSDLRATVVPGPNLPTAWRIVDPAPLEDLTRYYRDAEAEFGVPWAYLAAIHLVETRMGRIRGVSVAGASTVVSVSLSPVPSVGASMASVGASAGVSTAESTRASLPVSDAGVSRPASTCGAPPPHAAAKPTASHAAPNSPRQRTATRISRFGRR